MSKLLSFYRRKWWGLSLRSRESLPNGKIKSCDLTKFGLWILTSIGLVSCNFSHNSIAIENISEKQLGKTVQVTGKVTELAPLIRSAGYQLQDDTGSIWVITSNSLPILETKITIKATVQTQDMTLADKKFDELYLIELQKLAKPPE